MAQVWGQMQVLYEDTAVETVYFMNPLDVADYLGTAQITTQTAFGMSYIENFLGMGTAILASDIPKGKMYATGLVGIHTGAKYDNLSAETVAASGVGLFAENLGGIVIGTITTVAAA